MKVFQAVSHLHWSFGQTMVRVSKDSFFSSHEQRRAFFTSFELLDSCNRELNFSRPRKHLLTVVSDFFSYSLGIIRWFLFFVFFFSFSSERADSSESHDLESIDLLFDKPSRVGRGRRRRYVYTSIYYHMYGIFYDKLTLLLLSLKLILIETKKPHCFAVVTKNSLKS